MWLAWVCAQKLTRGPLIINVFSRSWSLQREYVLVGKTIISPDRGLLAIFQDRLVQMGWNILYRRDTCIKGRIQAIWVATDVWWYRTGCHRNEIFTQNAAIQASENRKFGPISPILLWRGYTLASDLRQYDGLWIWIKECIFYTGRYNSSHQHILHFFGQFFCRRTVPSTDFRKTAWCSSCFSTFLMFHFFSTSVVR